MGGVGGLLLICIICSLSVFAYHVGKKKRKSDLSYTETPLTPTDQNIQMFTDSQDRQMTTVMSRSEISTNLKKVRTETVDTDIELEDMYKTEQSEGVALLRQWQLSEYIVILIEKEGYELVEDWKELTIDDLRRFGFKEGHAKRFMRNLSELIGRNEGAMEEGKEENVQGQTNETAMAIATDNG